MITLTAPQGKAFYKNAFYYGSVVYVATEEDELTFTIVDAISEETNENEQNMTLEELKELRKAQFAEMQKEIALLFATAEKAVGAENQTLMYLIEQARLQRVMTLQAIEGFTDVNALSLFKIRESDAKPLKDALLNLINNVI